MNADDQKKLTTVAGAPVVDNQNVVTAGPPTRRTGLVWLRRCDFR